MTAAPAEIERAAYPAPGDSASPRFPRLGDSGLIFGRQGRYS